MPPIDSPPGARPGQTTLLGVSLIAASSPSPWGRPVAASAAFVLLILALAAGLLLQRRREAVVALIAAGDEHVPLGVVERERRRLVSRRTRTGLAASLDALGVEATSAPAAPIRALFDPGVVAKGTCGDARKCGCVR